MTMTPTELRARVVAIRTQSARLGLAVGLIGLVVLICWRSGAIAHFSLPLRLRPNSALAFLLGGTSLALRWPRLDHRAWTWSGIACAVIPAVMGLVTLAEHITKTDLGIDRILLSVLGSTNEPLRPSPIGAFCFVALGVALVLAHREQAIRVARIAAYCVLVPAVAGSLLYLYARPELIAQASTRVPLGSSLVLVVLAGATLRTFVTEDELAFLLSDSAGSLLRRRLLPAAVVVPVGLGVARLIMAERGWYNDALGLAFVVAVNMVAFVIAIELASRVLFAQEQQRRTAELGRQQSEARVDRLVEASVAGIVVTDPAGKIIRVNDTFAQIVGYSSDELLAPGFEITSLLPPKVRRGLDRATGEMRATGRAAPWEADYVKKDGTRVPVLLTSSLSTESQEVVSFVIDLSELRRAEQARRALEGELRAVIEAVNEGLITADAKGTITFANAGAERVFGAAAPSLVGRQLTDLLHEQFRTRYHAELALLATADTHPAGKTLEVIGRRDSGADFPLELSLATWTTDGAIQLVAIARDTTERQRRDAELADANRTKSQFLANMSHELRTPLNSIIGFTELMFREKAGPVSEIHKEYLGDILSASKHLLVLINDILDLSKVEAGKIDLRPTPVRATQLVAEVRDVVRGLAAEKHLKLDVAVDPAVDELVVDASRVKQILYNYLSNAIKFTPERGVIAVRIAPEGDTMFRLDVEDSGAGISEQDLPKLFVEFKQLDSSHAKTHQGTGLGLALTKRIAEAAGGRVAVASTVGRGSTFSAVLPRDMNQYT